MMLRINPLRSAHFFVNEAFPLFLLGFMIHYLHHRSSSVRLDNNLQVKEEKS